MHTLPTLTTNRLVLRPFKLSDAPEVQCLAGDRDVASTTLRIPHPYKDGLAEEWIGTHAEEFAKREGISLAVVLREGGTLVGAVGLEICKDHSRAELGYWIGKPYWGQGYATEAAKALVDYGFQVICLNRVFAHHLVRNPASGRVMLKIGMRHEGMLRQHTKRWEAFEDVYVYGVLKNEPLSKSQ
jgi:ribosomal-protein-alanine N-acetyltransferase